MSGCMMCDAGSPAKSVRHMNLVMEDGSTRVLAMGEEAYLLIQEKLLFLRIQDRQRRIAAGFLRRMRSIRATRHLVRR